MTFSKRLFNSACRTPAKIKCQSLIVCSKWASGYISASARGRLSAWALCIECRICTACDWCVCASVILPSVLWSLSEQIKDASFKKAHSADNTDCCIQTHTRTHSVPCPHNGNFLSCRLKGRIDSSVLIKCHQLVRPFVRSILKKRLWPRSAYLAFSESN